MEEVSTLPSFERPNEPKTASISLPREHQTKRESVSPVECLLSGAELLGDPTLEKQLG